MWLARRNRGLPELLIGLGILGIGPAGFALPLRMDPWMHLSSANVIVCLLWGAGESLRYWAMMRRRVRLSLADPVLANRFLLWGLGIGAAGVGSLIGNVAMTVTGRAMAELDGVTLSNSMFGLASAVLMWVAFLPPAAYRSWIEARARASARA